ncbi:MAG: DUF1638 domain-containing protein [Spirochaetes bacterium]|nr:DUF1638 domain-containing protein [Spirochaetota bacterium]
MKSALIACDVFRQEVEGLRGGSPDLAHVEFVELALHENPPRLKKALAERIGALEARGGFDRILLGFGLCGNALVGVGPSKCDLVVPKAHDCVSIFLGGREAHEALQKEHPKVYFFLPGWNRGGQAPTEERMKERRAEYVERFDEEEADFLMETEYHSLRERDYAVHIDLGIGDDTREQSRRTAAHWNWPLSERRGDGSFLRRLLSGPWDGENFLVVKPGQTIVHDPMGSFLRAQ